MVMSAQTGPWPGTVLKVWSVKQAEYGSLADSAVGEVPEARNSRSPSGTRSRQALFEDCCWGLGSIVEGTNSASLKLSLEPFHRSRVWDHCRRVSTCYEMEIR